MPRMVEGKAGYVEQRNGRWRQVDKAMMIVMVMDQVMG